ncbi:MAG: YicC/YloC family endoribonuclease [Butyricicoccus sp.]
MKSMTGYGRAKQELHGRTITAELRAVNHRYLDCTVKAPRQYGFLDDAVKKAAAARIARGKVEVYIGVETQEGGDIAVTVNHAVAEHYLAALHELADRYGLRDDVSVMSLAKLPDVLGSERIEQDADEMTRDVLSVFGEACDNFDEMRTREVPSWLRMCETVRPRSSAWSVRWRCSPERVREYREAACPHEGGAGGYVHRRDPHRHRGGHLRGQDRRGRGDRASAQPSAAAGRHAE